MHANECHTSDSNSLCVIVDTFMHVHMRTDAHIWDAEGITKRR